MKSVHILRREREESMIIDDISIKDVHDWYYHIEAIRPETQCNALFLERR